MSDRLLRDSKSVTYLEERRLFSTLGTDSVPVLWRSNVLGYHPHLQGFVGLSERIRESACPSKT